MRFIFAHFTFHNYPLNMYNEKTKCLKCGRDLSENEFVRISRDKTLRMCDPCWINAVAQIIKIKSLWNKLGL